MKSSTSSSRREPKLPRWRPVYRRPLVASRVQRREPPTARSRTGRRTLCSPCRPLTSGRRPRPAEQHHPRTDRPDTKIHHRPFFFFSFFQSHYRFVISLLVKRGLFTLCVHFSREKEKPNEWPGLTLTMDLPAHDDRLRGFPPPPAPPFKCEGSPSTRRAPQSFMLQLIFKKSFIKGLVGNLFLTREAH